MSSSRKIVCPCSHNIRLVFQPCIIINSCSLHLHSRLYRSLLLLYHMPCLMRQVPFLPRTHVDISALRIRQRLQLGGFGGIVVDFHIIHGHAGEVFNTGFQAIGHAGVVFMLHPGRTDAIIGCLRFPLDQPIPL